MKNKTEIILIEQSWVIRTGLSMLLLEEFERIKTYENAGDLDSFLSMLEMNNACCVIINAKKLEDFKRYLRRIPEHAVIVPLLLDNESNAPLDEFRFSISIDEERSVIIGSILRAVESLESKNKNEVSIDTLTKRERLILQLIAKGHSSKQIAEYLNISFNTVLTHRKNISTKLDIKTVSGLTVYAILNNLLQADETDIQ